MKKESFIQLIVIAGFLLMGISIKMTNRIPDLVHGMMTWISLGGLPLLFPSQTINKFAISSKSELFLG
jgi:hypothetical protein